MIGFILARLFMSLLIGYIIGIAYQIEMIDGKVSFLLCLFSGLVLIATLPKKF